MDPGTGSQTNDLNGGVSPTGLFWVVEIPRRAFKVHHHHRWAWLRLRQLPLVDTFQFGGPLAVPGRVDMDVIWQATAQPVERGSGSTVAPEDPAAFLGTFADARCIGRASAIETGFAFKTGRLTADGFFAEMGPERNGVFL